MEATQSGPTVHKARRRRGARRCSNCGSRAHDLRTCPKKHANGAKPKRRAVAGAGDGLARELANVREKLQELDVLKRALASAGFHPR